MEELQQGYRYLGLEGAQRGHPNPGLEIFSQYPEPFHKWPQCLDTAYWPLRVPRRIVGEDADRFFKIALSTPSTDSW